jgi:pyruvate, water dikinase
MTVLYGLRTARRALILAAFASFGLTAAACADGDTRSPDGGDAGAAGADPGVDGEYLTRLASPEDYGSLAAEGAEVKYLARVTGREPESVFAGAECLFQNTAKYEYHVQFLRTFPGYEDLSAERYADLVLRRESRSMWGGGLRLFPATRHPVSGTDGVLAYTVYSGTTADEMLTIDDIVEVDRRLKVGADFASDFLVFVPDGGAQTAALLDKAEELLAAGVTMVDPSTLRPGFRAETYVEGEGYGYLRLVTQEDGLENVGPRDVLVIDAAPNDLGLVAGLLTRVPQSLGSHVNLRLREKSIPSAAIANVFENTVITALTDRLVHVSASGSNVEVTPARLADAEAFWSSRRPNVGEPVSDLAVTELQALEGLSAADADAYGTKAANLGELSRVLPAENRVTGFALPFSAYADFMAETGLDAEVESLLADEAVRTDAAHKRRRLQTLRDGIRAAELSPALRERLATAIFEAYGDDGTTTRLRFRSSTNAEDLPGVSGAGLYDSRSGCLGDDLDADDVGPSACLTEEHEAFLQAELVRRKDELAAHPERTFLNELILDLESDLADEKSAWRAIRRVWASLWNVRAFDDREYYGIDHRAVFMGIAVHPSFVGEMLEAVVVTGLEPDAASPLYRVVSQRGEIGVVRPIDPEARPEILTFRRSEGGVPVEIELVQSSSLSDGGTSLWSDARVAELAELLFDVQDHFAAGVYPEIAPLMLDIEVDVTMDGRTVIKQARPYVF